MATRAKAINDETKKVGKATSTPYPRLFIKTNYKIKQLYIYLK